MARKTIDKEKKKVSVNLSLDIEINNLLEHINKSKLINELLWNYYLIEEGEGDGK
jgi:hypothetical protein